MLMNLKTFIIKYRIEGYNMRNDVSGKEEQNSHVEEKKN